MTTILITNDDGIHSPGLAALRKAVSLLGKCITVAPDRDKSAVSHSLTMNRPLLVRQLEEHIYTVDGTPVDCVALALKKILGEVPDLLVSGINIGANLGDDISYSGTVAAAMEATMYKIPAMAISIGAKSPVDFAMAAGTVRTVAEKVLAKGLPENTLLNINVPPHCHHGELRMTRQGRRVWQGSVHETLDPWGGKRYWIGGGTPVEETGEDTDVHVYESGMISVTPIQLDRTNHTTLSRLRADWSLEENSSDNSHS